MAKEISFLSKYVIISVFLREREIGLCFSLFLIKVILEWLLKIILMLANFYKRWSQNGLSENVLYSSKENNTILQHS